MDGSVVFFKCNPTPLIGYDLLIALISGDAGEVRSVSKVDFIPTRLAWADCFVLIVARDILLLILLVHFLGKYHFLRSIYPYYEFFPFSRVFFGYFCLRFCLWFFYFHSRFCLRFCYFRSRLSHIRCVCFCLHYHFSPILYMRLYIFIIFLHNRNAYSLVPYYIFLWCAPVRSLQSS